MKETEEKSCEARTLGFGYGSREVGRKSISHRMKIRCVLEVI
jgi:hypothetical protein